MKTKLSASEFRKLKHFVSLLDIAANEIRVAVRDASDGDIEAIDGPVADLKECLQKIEELTYPDETAGAKA